MSFPSEVYEIEDPSDFDILNSSFRLRALRHLARPMSVKELAEAMEVPVTRLYYHINLMSDAGVVTVVDERKVGAAIEKVYQTTAKSYTIGDRLLDSGHDPALLARIVAGVVLDLAMVDAESALRRHFAAKAPIEDLPGTLARTHTSMTPERAREFRERLFELVEEMSQDADEAEAEEYALSVAFLPIGRAPA